MEGAICNRIDGHARKFMAAAGLMIVCGGLIAAINSASPFAHGSWLAAYLVLVGGVAQLLLGIGCLGLPDPRLSTQLRRAQWGLWNLGILAVIGGVLADLFWLVVVGGLALLGALAGFAVGAGPASASLRGRWALILYRLAILALGASVVVGSALAGQPQEAEVSGGSHQQSGR